VTGLQTWNHTLVETNNEVNNLWVYAYQAINASNVFLKGLDDNASRFVQPAFPDDFASVRVPQYQAEARFLRGISYYYLLQLYARPYIDGNGSRPGCRSACRPKRISPTTTWPAARWLKRTPRC
jgi:hypothetical protein